MIASAFSRRALLALGFVLPALSPALAQTYTVEVPDPSGNGSAGASAQAVNWDTYANSRLGYSIAVPLGAFVPSPEGGVDGLTLLQVGGRGQIDIYGTANTQGLSPAEYADFIAGADRIREVTYSTGGNSWFVLSGFYNREGEDSTDLIFYTKYMFNAEGTALAAFEVSFPEEDKPFFAPIIEYMEDSLRPPQ